jgi:hypothetical protein
MGMSDFFSIAGIILTIIFGYLGIRLVKKNKYPGRIIYIGISDQTDPYFPA